MMKTTLLKTENKIKNRIGVGKIGKENINVCLSCELFYVNIPTILMFLKLNANNSY